jgi:hypothetical protein
MKKYFKIRAYKASKVKLTEIKKIVSKLCSSQKKFFVNDPLRQTKDAKMLHSTALSYVRHFKTPRENVLFQK